MITDEKTALDPAIKKLAEKICRSGTFPMLIVDDILCCVYSSRPKLVPVGTLLSLFIKDPIEVPLKKERDTVLIMKDVTYCARFIPLDKNYSFCSLLSFSDIMTIASYTDTYSIVEQRISMLKECSENIKGCAERLEADLPDNARRSMQTLDIKAELAKLNVMLNGLSDYAYTALSKNDTEEIIDTHALVEWIVKNSNSILEEHGKAFEFITDVDAFYIRTNNRYAIIAVLHAMQNALIYSPIEDIPVVSLTKVTKDEKRYVVVQVVNKTEVYSEDDDPDFCCRRCGLGLPVIKKFVQRADGDFYFETNGTKTRVGIMIPEFIPEDKDVVDLESGGYIPYDFGGRNIILEMMQDAISTFTKKKKRH